MRRRDIRKEWTILERKDRLRRCPREGKRKLLGRRIMMIGTIPQLRILGIEEDEGGRNMNSGSFF